MPYPNLFPFDRIQTYPLFHKKAQIFIKDLVEPILPAPPISPKNKSKIKKCAKAIKQTQEKNGWTFLLGGAHLCKNLGHLILNDLVHQNYINFLGFNMAHLIHDFELSLCGETSELVKENIRSGSFGCWETSELIHAILYSRDAETIGLGQAIGEELTQNNSKYRYCDHSILGNAYINSTAVSIFPHIAHDITVCSPCFDGGLIGKGGEIDFKQFAGALYENLENGVILVIGSQTMAAQVTEKAVSLVNNLRLQEKKGPIRNFEVFIVDLQKSNWDWNSGKEPPKTNPAYYNRMCKSFSRLGAKSVEYLCCDNIAFLHNLWYNLIGVKHGLFK